MKSKFFFEETKRKDFVTKFLVANIKLLDLHHLVLDYNEV